MKLRIGLDLDDTLNEFMNPYLKRFGYPKSDGEITKNVQQVLIKDREWWINLPIKNKINFIPELYCTKRINPKSYTRNSLKANDFPIKPIYQMYYQHGNKSTMIKGKVDVFIDDSISNFIKMNNSGVFCLLITAPHNQSFKTDLRINDLNYETILEKYNQYARTVSKF